MKLITEFISGMKLLVINNSLKSLLYYYSIRYGPFNQTQLKEILKEGELSQEFVQLVCWLVKNLKTSINSQQELSGITILLKNIITSYIIIIIIL